jgi:phage tail P2-like protein
MANIVLASALDGRQHLAAWDQLFEYRFAALELEKLLLMLIDTVDVVALPYLADQFDLLGVKGWNACKTDQDRRNLIKRAIELKRYQGTNYAIRRAVQSVGYYDIEIIEGVSAVYDGRFKHDGTINYGGGRWACFAVVLDIGEKKGISQAETEEAIELINEYKRAVTRLLWIDWKCTLIDTAETREFFLMDADMPINEDVDPINDTFDLTARPADFVDTLNTLQDGGLTINFINLAGDVTQEFLISI